jgi:hypothetical protein
MIHRSLSIRIFIMLLCLAVPFSALANNGKGKGSGSSIEWASPAGPHEAVQLIVSLPNGDTWSRDFNAGRPIMVRVSDLGDAPDGQYNYEYRVVPKVSGDVARKLAAARAANDDSLARKVMREAGLVPETYSGAFTVKGGSIVDTEGTEADAGVEASSMKDETLPTPAPSTAPRGGKIAVNDQVIPDDLIVQGSTCVGFDCVVDESFGFDTIRLKENNTRIKFEDTSVGSFPTNDWQLTANDSASGGASKFSIEDITGAKVPMTITAGAATNSIFVDSTGRVGFRTSAPVLDLHVATSNTPAIRLEQSNAGGFTAQTWDVAGNEANFFVRDVTGGSKLPFRIRPGAPTSSVDIAADGKVGVGTASPQRALHVITTAGGGTSSREQNLSATGYAGTEYVDEAGQIDLFVGVDNAGDVTRINSMNAQPIVFYLDGVEKARINTTGLAITGNMSATGTKSFAQVDPGDDGKAIYYAALEGPEAGTYYRGTAKTVDGEVTIELPGFFSRVTENEKMTVQLTPIGAPGQIYVASKSPEKLVIKVADGSADLEFDFLVQGIRKGYKDFQVERANDITNK